MKISFIFFFLIYCHRGVQCWTIGDVIKEKLTLAANFIGDAINSVKTTIAHFFLQQPRQHRLKQPRRQYKLDKTTLNSFIASTEDIKDTETEQNTEYLKLKIVPTSLLTVEELIKLHGKNFELHKVKTKDGYSLSLHRVIPLNSSTISINKTVLLHHGLLGSSADWIMLGKEKSLPYLLCDAGYDVWMANARGNLYSKEHEHLDSKTEQFWNFTWQEMGEYDLPAVIDYVWTVKQDSERISFIGHSMGATALLVLLSTNPVYNEYLRIGILLAPLAIMTEANGPLRVLSTIKADPPEMIFEVLGKGELLPQRRLPRVFTKKFCRRSKLFCSNPLFFITGPMQTIPDNKDPGFISRLLYHVPAGGSTHTILHYAQIIKTGKFHAYNNTEKEFPLRNITLPIALFSSNNDRLASIADVTRLFVNFVNPIEHVMIKDKNISHTEFVWGAYADTVVFSKVMNILDYSPTNITKKNEV